MTGQCGTADPRKTYKCVHHSDDTKNWNKLPEQKGEVDPKHGTTRQQADQLATSQVNVTGSHEAIQKNLLGIPTELPAPPPTK